MRNNIMLMAGLATVVLGVTTQGLAEEVPCDPETAALHAYLNRKPRQRIPERAVSSSDIKYTESVLIAGPDGDALGGTSGVTDSRGAL
jgi:hypothetical protein